MKRRTHSNQQPGRFDRMARVDELCREILAEELERIEDERLDFVTITHVGVDRDLSRAVVEFSSLGEAEDEAVEALEDHRVRLQSAIGRQARLRRTPELRFEVDQAIERAARIEALLRDDRARDDD